MSESLFSFLRRWWNWLRLPHFRSDDAIAEWFENADPSRLYLPLENGAAVTEDVKITWTAE